MAKMGISTVQSYQGAQIFEAVGLSQEVIDDYFTGTQSKLSGLSIQQIDTENKMRQQRHNEYLDSGSVFQWRQQGQHHVFNPTTIHLLQHVVRMIIHSLKLFRMLFMSKEMIIYAIY